jgi:hypothetical protein
MQSKIMTVPLYTLIHILRRHLQIHSHSALHSCCASLETCKIPLKWEYKIYAEAKFCFICMVFKNIISIVNYHFNLHCILRSSYIYGNRRCMSWCPLTYPNLHSIEIIAHLCTFPLIYAWCLWLKNTLNILCSKWTWVWFTLTLIPKLLITDLNWTPHQKLLII